jgi:hypothetical protein
MAEMETLSEIIICCVALLGSSPLRLSFLASLSDQRLTNAVYLRFQISGGINQYAT